MAIIWDSMVFLIALVLVVERVGAGEENRRTVVIGANLRLPCAETGAEDILHFFTWSRNGVLLPERSIYDMHSRFVILSDFSLLVENVVEDDDGLYTCTIQSDPPVLNNFTVQVEVPPSIKQFPTDGNLVIHEGGSAELFCLARGNPHPFITWNFEGKMVNAADYTIEIHPNRSVASTYRIVNARRLDGGVYSCEVDRPNRLDPIAAFFSVDVLYSPQIYVKQKSVHAGLGSFADLVCDVVSHPSAQVIWFRQGEDSLINSDRIGNITNGTQHILRFKNVHDSDLGVYSCRAENIVGKAEATVEISGVAERAALKVSPPRDGFPQEGSDRHRLIWDVVSYSPIYEFRLWLRPHGKDEDHWINIIIPATAAATSSFLHSHMYTIQDLGAKTIYEITVQSRNRFGWSEESNIVYLSGNMEDELDEEESNLILPSTTEKILTTTTTESDPTTTTTETPEVLTTEQLVTTTLLPTTTVPMPTSTPLPITTTSLPITTTLLPITTTSLPISTTSMATSDFDYETSDFHIYLGESTVAATTETTPGHETTTDSTTITYQQLESTTEIISTSTLFTTIDQTEPTHPTVVANNIHSDEDVKEQTMQQKPRRPTLTSNATTRIGTEVILALVLLSCNLSFLIQALPLTFF